jgi:hypothetical protein
MTEIYLIELTVSIFATSDALLSFFPHTVLNPSTLLFREAEASVQLPRAAYRSPAYRGREVGTRRR